jgi:hypothetical protein
MPTRARREDDDRSGRYSAPRPTSPPMTPTERQALEEGVRKLEEVSRSIKETRRLIKRK